MLDTADTRRLHDVEGADEVGINICARVFQAVANPGLGREVHDGLRFERRADGGQRGVILQHEDGVLEARVAFEDVAASLFQVDVIVGGEAVDAEDLMAVAEQAQRQMEADEARRAGDQNTHVPSSNHREDATRCALILRNPTGDNALHIWAGAE